MNYERRRTTVRSYPGDNKSGLLSLQPHKSAGTALTVTAASLIASAALGLVTTNRFSKVTTSTQAQKNLQMTSNIAHSLALFVGVLVLMRAGFHAQQHGMLSTSAANVGRDDDHSMLSGWVLAVTSALLIFSAAVPMAMYQSYKKDKTIPANRAKEQKTMFGAQIAFVSVGALSFIGSSGYAWQISHQ